MVRAQISEAEVQLKVLRGSATDQNPAVIRLNAELRALRSELARMESSQGGASGSAVDMPVGRIPEAAIEYVRARRELKIQEMMLEGMLRQYEIAKLDVAKEGRRCSRSTSQCPRLQVQASRALMHLAGAAVASCSPRVGRRRGYLARAAAARRRSVPPGGGGPRLAFRA